MNRIGNHSSGRTEEYLWKAAAKLDEWILETDVLRKAMNEDYMELNLHGDENTDASNSHFTKIQKENCSKEIYAVTMQRKMNI